MLRQWPLLMIFLINIKLSQSISEIDDVTDVGITMPYLSKMECL